MRQAYDYWQNQPGNYPEPWRRPRGVGHQRSPRRGGVVTRVGDHARWTQPRGAGSADATCRQVAIQLPPLSSPRCGPPWGSRVVRPAMPHRIRPSGGGLQSPSQHPKADTGESGPPRSLVWTVASSQPSTDPEEKVPASPEANRASVPAIKPAAAPHCGLTRFNERRGSRRPRWAS